MKKLMMVIFIIALIYLALFFFFDFGGVSLGLLTPFLLLPIALYILLRFGKTELLKVVGLLGFDFCIFIVSSSEDRNTGVYLHFISSSAAAIALYEYEQRWKSISFVILAFGLLLLVNLYSFDIVPYRTHRPEEANLLFTMHTLASMFVSLYCVFMIIGMNRDAENYLHHKQQIIEKQNRELNKANEELDRFVYSASHDLRAPLTSISGLIKLMDIDDSTPKEEFINKLKNQVGVMENFIRDIVDYSRNTRIAVKNEPVALHKVVSDVLKTLSHYENAQRICFENTLDGTL